MSYREITIWMSVFLLLIRLLGRLEHLICKTLESIAVLGFMLSLGVENAYLIQETFKFTWAVLTLLLAMRPLHIVHGMIHLLLLVVALGGARRIRVA
jgi:hypothetical protein